MLPVYLCLGQGRVHPLDQTAETEVTYVLADGRQIVILSDRTAKLLALDGSPITYMVIEEITLCVQC